MSMSSPGSSTGSIRRSVLARLREEIHGYGRPALVALAGSDHPVLYTTGPDGRRVAVVALWWKGAWWFVWGRDGQAPADSPREAAATLAGGGPADPDGTGKARPLPSRPGGERTARAAPDRRGHPAPISEARHFPHRGEKRMPQAARHPAARA